MNDIKDLTDGTGILTSKEVMTAGERRDFLNEFVRCILKPTLEVVGSMSVEKVNLSRINMIMATFSSIRMDVELHNLTITENNANTVGLENMYKKYRFFMMSAAPAYDRIDKNILILFEFYKKITTSPMEFLEEMKRLNTQIIGYMYIAQLVGLAQKNYRNKFILANRAKTYFYDKYKDMRPDTRDRASIAMAQMAIEYHTNSMILDNLKEHDSSNSPIQLNQNYINTLKSSPFILYNPKYNFKMSQIDILDKLVEDAQIEFFRGKGTNDPTELM